MVSLVQGLRGCLWGMLVIAGIGRADPVLPHYSLNQLLTLNLSELTALRVVSGTIQALPESLKSVITRQSIDDWGYRSIAQAMQFSTGWLPACGGGDGSVTRLDGRWLNGMVNGQPVRLTHDRQCPGVELMLMDLVDRIEVWAEPGQAPVLSAATIRIFSREPDAALNTRGRQTDRRSNPSAD